MSIVRPSWDYWCMAIAEVVAIRSHDPDTKHGAVIVDQHHRIIGVGYNGFPRGGPDDIYPNTRPEKYALIVHAEANAILNCNSKPEGCTLYVTGLPCPRCMGIIIQAGIKQVVYGQRLSAMIGPEEHGGVEQLATNHGVTLREYDGVPVGNLLQRMADVLEREARCGG